MTTVHKKFLNIFGHEIHVKMKEETFLFFLPFIVPQQGIFKMAPLISFLGFGPNKILLNCNVSKYS